jgi:hypothetical protein
MTALIGNIGPFDANTDQWISYKERLEQFFAANEVDDAKHVAVLLSVVGAKTYELLRTLTAPEKPAQRTFAQLCEVLGKHLAPKPLIIAERFRFHKRNQKQGETISEYCVAIQKLSEQCEFGTTLKDTLRDRLVCGLASEHIQRKLLVEVDLTYDRAKAIALAAETATKDAEEFRKHPIAETQVNKLLAKAAKRSLQPSKPSQPQATTTAAANASCGRCGKQNHTQDQCYFRDKQCHQCLKIGHVKRMCKSGRLAKPLQTMKRNVHYVDESLNEADYRGESSEEEAVLHYVTDDENHTVGSLTSKPLTVNMVINGVNIDMEIDSGSPVSLMPQVEFEKHFGSVELEHSDVRLSTFTGESLKVNGFVMVDVTHDKKTYCLKLYVVDHGRTTLLGRDWLHSIKLDWKRIYVVNSVETAKPSDVLSMLKDRYAVLFEESLGKLVNFKAKLYLKPDFKPVFMKARPVPYAMRPKVEKELDRLESEGVLSKTTNSEWATPIVPVIKRNNQIRICGDYKITVNPNLKVDRYPMPKPQDIFASLAGGIKYSKLDLRQAYLQCEVSDDAKELLTLNTHRGLYTVNRLQFGIASAPSIWQRKMEQILHGIPFCHCRLDDILTTGRNDTEHVQILQQVCQRLSDHGLRLNAEKCHFMQDRLEYCGNTLTRNGVQQSPDKIEAIVNAPTPSNVTQLRSILGLINFYRNHLPNVSSVLNPLNQLLKKNSKWNWNEICDRAYSKVKQMIAADTCLIHFDPSLPILLATDAGPSGIGCVLSHRLVNGDERPICFSSRTLTKAEQNYSQLDREGLSIVWSVKKMSDYLMGRHFTLITDNRPIAAILAPDKATPPMTAARIQRWSSFLSSYDYEVECRSTKQNANADFCSRLPLRDYEDKLTVSAIEAFYEEQFEILPVTADLIRRYTRTDGQLSQVYEFTLSGWPHQVQDELKPFFNRKMEISISQGCLLWGNRVIIPSKCRKQLLMEIHNGHLGMVRMKAVARSFIWWPGLDSQIEDTVRKCHDCQAIQRAPAAVMHPWERPSSPWQRIHADFLGPVDGNMFLIVVDAYSKWPEVIPMKDTTSARTIEVMRSLFATWGLPKQIHTDNAQQFVSTEFQHFLKMNGVNHTTSPVYHPSSNGQAERFVQTFKRALKAMKSDPGSLKKKIACFLLTYRTTVNGTTGEIPAMLMTGRRLRTRLDLIRPTPKETKTKSGQRERRFETGQKVWTRDFRANQPKWIPAEIESNVGTVMYNVKVKTANGVATWRRHVDQLMTRPEAIDWHVTPTSTQQEDRSTEREPLIPILRRVEHSEAEYQQDSPSTTPTSETAETRSEAEVDMSEMLPSTTLECESRETVTSDVTDIHPRTAVITSRGRTVKTPTKFNDFVINR